MKVEIKDLIKIEVEKKEELELAKEVIDHVMNNSIPTNNGGISKKIIDTVLKKDVTEEIKPEIKEVLVEDEITKSEIIAASVLPKVSVVKEAVNEDNLIKMKIGNYHLINCTSHVITVKTEDKEYNIGPSTLVCRIKFDHIESKIDKELPLFTEEKGAAFNVPAPKPNVLYIVSRIVYDYMPERTDFICPNTMRAEKVDNKVNCVPGFITRLK